MSSPVIVAVSTPAGVGGVALVRLSGAGALQLVLPHLGLGALRPRHATLATFAVAGAPVDELIALYYPAPHSYTGEEVVELMCHGSAYIQQALVEALVADGARLAGRGEFTQRAFLNGRLDLSQAEAVADLIDAATPAAHRLAVSQLRGGYANELAQMRAQLVELASLLELELDFSQEDVAFADRGRLLALCAALRKRVCSLRASFARGNALKRGVPVAIVGKPNAGKSSLLNALLHDDRAIVSDIPGTTRDTIEEILTADGISFRFIDTAGLRQTDALVESMGLARSIRAAQQASIILFVRDIREPFGAEAMADVESVTSQCDMEGKRLVMVHNKCDLATGAEGLPGHVVSAKEGTGIDALVHDLAAAVASDAQGQGDVLLSNLRHYEALGHLDEALGHVEQGLSDEVPTDLVAVDIRDAIYHLGTITGDVVNDEILGSIFSRFCIGK